MIWAITTQFRNEQNKITAWLEYHRRQGFNTFILYDDYSDDNSSELIRNWGAEHPDVQILLNFTRGGSNQKRYDSCLQTDIYEEDMTLHQRIADSFLSGFEQFSHLCKSQKDTAFCALIDVDELFVTDQPETIVRIVHQEFQRANSTMLYVPSFDVDTRGLSTDKGVFSAQQTCYRWSATQRAAFHHGAYAHRGKSILSPGHIFDSRTPWTVIHCGGRTGENSFEEAVPLTSQENTPSSSLRIHHYRVPISRGCSLYDEHDSRAYKWFAHA
jgi:hypothetical protein